MMLVMVPMAGSSTGTTPTNTTPNVRIAPVINNVTINVTIETINGRIDQRAVWYDNVSDVFDDGDPIIAATDTASYRLQLIITQLL